MDDLDIQIELMQAKLTSAVRSGEPENSPQLRQMDARLEQMQRLWTTHRRIRMGQPEVHEGAHVNHVS